MRLLVAARLPADAAKAATGSHLTPAQFRRLGTPLLQQQFWLWGQDIKRPQGNLLLGQGFTKVRPPDGVEGSRAYTLDLGGGGSLVLWGFGLFHGEPSGGLYVARTCLAPRLMASSAPPSGVWLPRQLPVHRRPADPLTWAAAWRLVATVLGWIAGYERWVCASQGNAYRAACLANWPRRTGDPSELSTRWEELAMQAESLCSQVIARKQ